MSRIRGRNKGFSLLEVLIAVVVLSVGLLALAALQGSLTRSSADAKVRSRVAAALTAHMDGLRQTGFAGMGDGTTTLTGTATSCVRATPDWLDCAAADAGLATVSVVQNIRIWSGAASFTEQAAGASIAPNIPQFKRIKLDATWSDATGGTHAMQLQSDVSAMQLTSNIVVPPEPLASGGGGPIVRTTSPATAGVLPIAMGTDSNSATTNPSPELVGSKNNQIIVGTRFSVLGYSAPGFGNSVTIQRRFDQEVVKCTCKYGAGGNNLAVGWRTAMWPAVWNGTTYEVVAPDGNPAAPGQSLSSGPKSGVTQSDLCTECCRDHHDTTTASQTKFDPERADGLVTKYDLVGGVLTATTNTTNGTYVDSCRLVRVDGFWRTAADLYARQYGLLETQAVGGVAAKSGLPTTDAVTRYTNFVKNYLDDYNGTSANTPTTAQSIFSADASFNAAAITIASASPTDYRYLHGRGLYVDYLEQKARDKLVEVLADNGPRGLCPTGSVIADCVMPYLPFTTVNLTEIAKWLASNTAILTVNSGNLLATDPAQPSGSRTVGKANGSAANNTSIRWSNSGVAINAAMTGVNGVDPTDNSAEYTDTQDFTVGGASGSGFDARITGGGANPFLFFTLGTDNNVECLKPAGGDHHCVVSAVNTMPQAGSLRVSNYWLETTTNMTVTTSCGGSPASAKIDVPTFYNYVLTSASIGALAGNIQASVNDNKTTESTTVSFTAIAANSLVLLGFTQQSGTNPTYATVTSCTTNGGGKQINNVTWNKPWTQP